MDFSFQALWFTVEIKMHIVFRSCLGTCTCYWVTWRQPLHRDWQNALRKSQFTQPADYQRPAPGEKRGNLVTAWLCIHPCLQTQLQFPPPALALPLYEAGCAGKWSLWAWTVLRYIWSNLFNEVVFSCNFILFFLEWAFTVTILLPLENSG